MLAERLRSQGTQVTCLPDLVTLRAGDLCSRLITLFASSGDPFMRHGDVFTDTYLAAAIRADIAATLIDPALRAGHVVIEDRGIHTMYSYSLASVFTHHDWDVGSAVNWLESVGRLTGRGPNVALRLNVPVSECVARAARRGTRAWNAEQESFLGNVDLAYQELQARDPRMVSIDARDSSAVDTHALVRAAVADRLGIPAPGRTVGMQGTASEPRLSDHS
jgi:dTMP kinase